MINNYSKAYVDICYILSALEEKYTKQIPKELIKFFKDNAEQQYLSRIDLSKPLIEQNISEETEQLICLINLNYWCTPEEKKELLKKYETNEKEIEEQLQNKYQIKFKEKLQIQDVNVIAVIEKENIFIKIIKFIKGIMIKKK